MTNSLSCPTEQKRHAGRWKYVKTSSGFRVGVWEPPVPRIHPDFLNCVFYIYPSEEAANAGLLIDADSEPEVTHPEGGTGFVVGITEEIEIPLGGGPVARRKVSHLYGVTCGHVLDGISGTETFLRVNKRYSDQPPYFDIIPVPKSSWVHHPDESNDVAVFPMRPGVKHNISYVPDEDIIMDTHALFGEVGIGDEVFMVGRFIDHEGRQQNLPIVRFGNVAMMPTERIHIWERSRMADSFLVDMRSVPGFSGSPVFTYEPNIPLDALRDDLAHESRKSAKLGTSPARLIGIDWGQLWTFKDAIFVNSQTKMGTIAGNSSIAGVTPAWKLWEILHLDQFKEQRNQANEEFKKLLHMQTSRLHSSPGNIPESD